MEAIVFVFPPPERIQKQAYESLSYLSYMKKIDEIHQDIFKLAIDPDLITVLENMESKINEIIDAIGVRQEKKKRVAKSRHTEGEK